MVLFPVRWSVGPEHEQMFCISIAASEKHSAVSGPHTRSKEICSYFYIYIQNFFLYEAMLSLCNSTDDTFDM